MLPSASIPHTGHSNLCSDLLALVELPCLQPTYVAVCSHRAEAHRGQSQPLPPIVGPPCTELSCSSSSGSVPSGSSPSRACIVPRRFQSLRGDQQQRQSVVDVSPARSSRSVRFGGASFNDSSSSDCHHSSSPPSRRSPPPRHHHSSGVDPQPIMPNQGAAPDGGQGSRARMSLKYTPSPPAKAAAADVGSCGGSCPEVTCSDSEASLAPKGPSSLLELDRREPPDSPTVTHPPRANDTVSVDPEERSEYGTIGAATAPMPPSLPSIGPRRPLSLSVLRGSGSDRWGSLDGSPQRGGLSSSSPRLKGGAVVSLPPIHHSPSFGRTSLNGVGGSVVDSPSFLGRTSLNGVGGSDCGGKVGGSPSLSTPAAVDARTPRCGSPWQVLGPRRARFSLPGGGPEG